jgi:hypothetical protein
MEPWKRSSTGHTPRRGQCSRTSGSARPHQQARLVLSHSGLRVKLTAHILRGTDVSQLDDGAFRSDKPACLCPHPTDVPNVPALPSCPNSAEWATVAGIRLTAMSVCTLGSQSGRRPHRHSSRRVQPKWYTTTATPVHGTYALVPPSAARKRHEYGAHIGRLIACDAQAAPAQDTCLRVRSLEAHTRQGTHERRRARILTLDAQPEPQAGRHRQSRSHSSLWQSGVPAGSSC